VNQPGNVSNGTTLGTATNSDRAISSNNCTLVAPFRRYNKVVNMVRNWQARVEQADVRRKQAKQKKQLSEDKRQWKQWVVDFVNNQLDSNVKNIQKIIQLKRETNENVKGSSNPTFDQLQLQIWTDASPASRAAVSDAFDDVGGDADTVKGCKNRSKSFGENSQDDNDQVAVGRSGKTKGRGRTNSITANADTSTPSSNSKKKAHPRSKGSLEQSAIHSSGTLENDEPFICRSHFFTGICDHMNSRGSGKKAVSCRNVHLSNEPNCQTLYHALMKWNAISIDNTPQLQKAATAEILSAEKTSTSNASVSAVASLPSSATSDSVIVIGAMDMVHFVEIPLSLKADNEETLLPLSGQISAALSKMGLFFGSVVYFAINGVLIFDRHQDGSLYKRNEDLLVAMFGYQTVSNALGCKRDRFCTNPDDVALLVNMPALVLLQIASFLPDESVGSMMQVCKSWRNEIGWSDSPFWKFLLDRNEWPYIGSSCSNCTLSDQFRQHYAVMRDMRAFEKGYLALHTSSFSLGRSLDRDFALHNFSSNMNPPPSDTRCVAVEEWSTNRLLVAYRDDCTVRLFETVPKVSCSGTTAGDKFCRELICYRFDPYWNTKRKHCFLEQLALDDDYIIALCGVEEVGVFGRKEILVVLSRDDYLLGESGTMVNSLAGYPDDASNPLRVLAIEDTVQHYLISHASCPPQLLPLLRGEEDGDISISISKALASCGNGLVLMEVIIYFESENGSESSSWLFLVSTKLNQILWSDGGIPEALPHGGPIEKTIVARRSKFKGRSSSRAAYDFVVGSASSTMGNVVIGTVNPVGIVENFEVLESSHRELERPDEGDGWFKPRNERLVTMTPTDVVALDFWIRAAMDAPLRRTIVSFYPRNKNTASDDVRTLTLPGKVDQIRCIRDVYLVLICQQLEVDRTPELFDTSTGQWFGADYSTIDSSYVRYDVWDYSIPLIVVHIPTLREIGRILLKDGQLHEVLDRLVFPVLVADSRSTIGLGVSSKGIVMTGDDVRFCIWNKEDDMKLAGQPSSTKKKKNSVRSKKDGFRTHNGDRCY
jgi:F-box domain